MPNCTVEGMPFSKLGRREIEARFDGSEVSSDGGLLLLRQVERRLGLLKQVAPVLLDPRSPLLVRHTTEQMLRQRVFGLCQGYEDINDHDRLNRTIWPCRPPSTRIGPGPPVQRCAASRTGPTGRRSSPSSAF